MDDSVTPCFCCGNPLGNAFSVGDIDNHPWGGTIFIAKGNYGSTVFDPINGSLSVQVNICDGCMTSPDRADRIRLYRTEYTEPRRVIVPIPEDWRVE